MKKAFGCIILAFLAAALSSGEAQVGRKPPGQPDLVVTGIDFQKVQSGTDSQGKTYWIFNVTAKIKNQGNGNAGAFKVLVERNNGAGGSWQTACPTCVIDVSGLAAGQEMTTPPRQFNNANGAPSRFRFTADSAGQVGESEENNNGREEVFVSRDISQIPGGGLAPLLKCDLQLVSWDYKDVISTIMDGKTIISFKIEATVKNIGKGQSPAAQLLYERCDCTKICFNQYFLDIPALAAGTQTVLVTNPLTYEGGSLLKCCHVEVDPKDAVSETNEFNNSGGYKKIPGTN